MKEIFRNRQSLPTLVQSVILKKKSAILYLHSFPNLQFKFMLSLSFACNDPQLGSHLPIQYVHCHQSDHDVCMANRMHQIKPLVLKFDIKAFDIKILLFWGPTKLFNIILVPKACSLAIKQISLSLSMRDFIHSFSSFWLMNSYSSRPSSNATSLRTPWFPPDRISFSFL